MPPSLSSKLREPTAAFAGRNIRFAGVCCVALLGLALTVRSADVMLTADDVLGANVSFNSAGNWENRSAPVAGDDYFTGKFTVRTPAGSSANFAFEGRSLSIDPGGALIYNGGKTANIITVSRLMLNGGSVINQDIQSSSVFSLAGNLHITGNGGTLAGTNRPIIVDALVSGEGTLILSGKAITFTNAQNTFTGDILVKNGTVLSLADSGRLAFAIKRSGFNNRITGVDGTSVAILEGSFVFDLAEAETSTGSSWTIVDMQSMEVVYAPTFRVAGFSKNNGVWWNGRFRFDEKTGMLTVEADAP